MSDAIATLDELLSDPMVRLVMARDGVEPDEIRTSLERARQRASDRAALPLPHMIPRECWQNWAGR